MKSNCNTARVTVVEAKRFVFHVISFYYTQTNFKTFFRNESFKTWWLTDILSCYSALPRYETELNAARIDSTKWKRVSVWQMRNKIGKFFTWYPSVIHKPTTKYYFDLQTSTHALMFIVHHLECVRLSTLMKLAVCVMKTVLPIMTQCALRMGQHMTINAGMSCTTVEDWRIIWCITQEAVRVRMRLPWN